MNQFNFYTQPTDSDEETLDFESQSPQTGQFNSYQIWIITTLSKAIVGLNPLKRVNSILTVPERVLNSFIRSA